MYGIEDSNNNLEQPSNLRDSDSEGLSKVDHDYLDEALETCDPEIIVNRIDEICDSYPPKAIDSNPEISRKLSDVKEDIDKQFLEAPNDMEQVKEISEGICEIRGTKFEDWKNLSPQERLEVLQKVEIVAADVSHRPACEIKGECLGEGRFGLYNPKDNTITVNTDYLGSDYESYKESMDTIIHEGRHAYQHYNVDVRQVHPSEGDCQNWRENLNDNMWGLFPENYGYQSAEEVGPLRYWMQPVEADARAFAADVFKQLNQMA